MPIHCNSDCNKYCTGIYISCSCDLWGLCTMSRFLMQSVKTSAMCHDVRTKVTVSWQSDKVLSRQSQTARKGLLDMSIMNYDGKVGLYADLGDSNWSLFSFMKGNLAMPHWFYTTVEFQANSGRTVLKLSPGHCDIWTGIKHLTRDHVLFRLCYRNINLSFVSMLP